jgi:hypothetical protein
VGKVSGNAGCVDDIVEGELVHEGGELQEQRQRLPRGGGQQELLVKSAQIFLFRRATHLSNTARGTSDNYFCSYMSVQTYSSPSLFVIVM